MRWLLFGIVALFVGSLTASHASETEVAVKRETLIRSLAWSPDGKEFVFATNRGYEPLLKEGIKAYYLWRVGVDGKSIKQITFPGKDEQGKLVHYTDNNPQWSPDGSKIVFDSDRGEVRHDDPNERLRQIFVCDADGKQLKQLSNGQGWINNVQPSYHPDGKHLAWVTDRNAGTDILLTTVDGKEIRYLAITANLREFYPSWSSDGQHIAFMAQKQYTREPAALSIYVRGTKEEEKPQTTKPTIITNTANDFGLVHSCSPAQNVVAFIKDEKGQSDLWQMNLDGTGLRRITNLRPTNK